LLSWCGHAGNGTQKAFYRDSEVLFISVHQDCNYPANSGLVSEVGEGEGQYFTVNIPLPPGCGGGAYTAAFEQVGTHRHRAEAYAHASIPSWTHRHTQTER
jgi:acetoin utilization deacetylase AcuC-like enzyme